LILINTIIPLQFTYAKSQGKDILDDLIGLLVAVPAENNVIIQKFSSIKTNNAFESQSLQLKNEYCNMSKCMECAIGISLIKQP
jgi:hypothetical protein